MKSKGRIDKIALFGHKGLIGSAILKELKKRNYKHIITAERKNLNLIKKEKVELFIKKKKPKLQQEWVVLLLIQITLLIFFMKI